MPNVDGKKFSYDKKGMADAKKAAVAKMVTMKKSKKSGY
jgi:hypothetical protein